MLAIACVANSIVIEKPTAHTLAQVDWIVGACAAVVVPLCCGTITITHPSFAGAKTLWKEGAIGPLVSAAAAGSGTQYQNGSYFLDAAPT